MVKIRSFVLIVGLSLLAACVTIPQESVELSSEVGIGLKKQHQSQVDLINLHFSIKRGSLDKAMKKALNSYFSALTSKASIELNRSQFDDVALFVLSLNDRNNAAKEELEKTRVLLIKKLNENYLALNQANSSITGLLQSAVTVKEARSEAYKKLSKATGGKIDLGKIFIELDDFVLKNGEEAGKAIKLVEKIESLFNSNTNDKGDN